MFRETWISFIQEINIEQYRKSSTYLVKVTVLLSKNKKFHEERKGEYIKDNKTAISRNEGGDVSNK